MNAKICDCCGKVVTGDDIEVGNGISTIKIPSIGIEPGCSKDLCDSCMESTWRFIKQITIKSDKK